MDRQHDDSAAANKRQRTRRACDSCFDVKARCDGSLPCLRCKASGRPCRYSRIVKKRGPRPKRTDNLSSQPQDEAQSELGERRLSTAQYESVNNELERTVSASHSASIPSPAAVRMSDAGHFTQAAYDANAPPHPRTPIPNSQYSPWPPESAQPHDLPDHYSAFYTQPGGQTLTHQAQHEPLIHAECRYACLRPILPALEGIMEPDVACDLLDHYFTQPNTSLFTSASPYILDPIIRQDSLLRRNDPRETSPTLLLTILWVCISTAPVEVLFAPGRRSTIGEKLRRIIMSQLNVHHSGANAHSASYGTANSNLLGHNQIATGLLELPCKSLDDLLTLILVTIVISGSDVKNATIQWWHRAVRLAQDMRLNVVDPKGNDQPPRICSNIPCTCSRDRSSMTETTYLEHQEERRRTMWLLFALDRHWALCYNCMPLILDQDLQVYIPLPDHIWNDRDFHSNAPAYQRSYGPPLTIAGTGFYDFFLPLMTILGDIIHAHHTQRHPRFRQLDWSPTLSVIEELLASCAQSIDLLPSQLEHQRTFETQNGSSNETPKYGGPEEQKRCAIVQLYAKFVLHVLYVLLYGRWDALSMISPDTPPAMEVGASTEYQSPAEVEISDWITSPQFASCASHAIMASETLSVILTSDPELAFTPYLFGIYLLQGSFIMLLFVHRMPEVEGGRNESVEKACETIIRAHEISIATLSVEYQSHVRLVFRAALNRVKEHAGEATSPNGQNRRHSTVGNSPMFDRQSGTTPSHIRRLLGLYRWTDGTRGLAF